MQYDIIIAGGGIVGLATAFQLQQKRPDWKIAVLEKETAPALHQSSRNSGVIHSGIYYRPGSLRALNCKRGYDMLLRFCEEYNIPHEVCGKIIVAVEERERPSLDKILANGIQNGLQGIRKIGPEEVRDIEPHVQAVEAVWVPQAGIIDYGQVARKYAEIFQHLGGTIYYNQTVSAIRKEQGGVVVEAGNAFNTKTFVNCAGLYSDHVAAKTGIDPGVKILPFRGEFYDLKPEAQHLVRNLIYPVPNPNFPFLGVHFTRMIQGGIEAGPNAVLAFRREGYSKWDFHAGELAETLAYPGFRKIARKYWRDGWAEMQRSYIKGSFVKALQRLIPAIQSENLVPGRSGVRAMACDPQGNLLDDFLILTQPGIVNVCNAPSPAATASLAVGETIAEKILSL
ncbi:MAG TPA: L-2-hydroxyglutarate oxidase [Saprospiraceae bacterium]|nr:L-2-hydroxyglutarate oxidase [Saprospiraceae bacterium]